MSFFQALAYFLREAAVSLARSMRVSLLAVVTIAVSLFLAGTLFLVSSNLSATVASWRQEARFVVYLDPKIRADDRAAIVVAFQEAPWVESFEEIDEQSAAQRFAKAFPSLAELVSEGGQGRLPPSIEARLRAPAASEVNLYRRWLDGVQRAPGVEGTDDDRDWIAQVETALALVRALGIALTAVLVGASIFTISSVVRFTALLYRDEIAVMRLVGATEFFIRGPFYFEGLLQGLLGSVVALGGLFALHSSLRPQVADSILASAIASRFLSPSEIALMLLFGALAGLMGAVVSLGREGLPQTSPQSP